MGEGDCQVEEEPGNSLSDHVTAVLTCAIGKMKQGLQRKCTKSDAIGFNGNKLYNLVRKPCFSMWKFPDEEIV